MPSSAFSR
jgi:site-specific recombinase XerD